MLLSRKCIALFLLLSSCSPKLDPYPSFHDVREEVQCRTGETIHWDRCGQDPCAQVRKILSKPLILDDVIEVALLNNRRLQAAYENIGIAQADLVQACLLKNPILDFQLRYDHCFSGEKVIEMGIIQNFLDILLKPLQRKLACAELAKVKSLVAGEAIQVIADVKTAFFTLQSAKRMLELKQESVLASEASFEAADRLWKAGNIKKLEYLVQSSLLEQSKINAVQAELNVVEARERLNALMGLWEGSGNWDLSEELYRIPGEFQEREDIENLVIANSLDLSAARHEIRKTAARMGIEVTEAVIPEFGIGVDSEREPDGNWFAGPQFSIGIPVFDLGQARSAAGRAEIRQLCDKYYAMAVELRSAARASSFSLWNYHRQFKYFQDTLVPLMKEVTNETLLQLNAMQVGVFELLGMKMQEIEAEEKMIQAYMGYWVARIELEKLIQGKQTGIE